MWGWVRRKLESQPVLVDVSLAALTTAHALASRLWPILDVLRPLTDVDTAIVVSIHLGITVLAAVFAGFSGVLVVFALTGTSARFRRLRRTGGRALRSNWTWCAVSAVVAAFLGVVGALATALGHPTARWVLELAFVLCAHAAARQIWLLASLAAVVSAEDEDTHNAQTLIDADALLARGLATRGSMHR